MLPHPLTNFEKKRYYQNEPEYNGIYSRNNFPEIKDKAYVTNPDDFRPIGTHWIAFYVNNNNVTYFGSFGVKHIPKKIQN